MVRNNGGVPLQATNLFATSLSSTLTTRLNQLNFLAWKSQVLPIVIGHGLESFLFSLDSPPQNLVLVS